MIFHVIFCDMIPYVKNRTVSAHINLLLEFCKLFKRHGHIVYAYAFGDKIPKKYCTEHFHIPVEYDLAKINHPKWYTSEEMFKEERDQIALQFSKLVQIQLEKHFPSDQIFPSSDQTTPSPNVLPPNVPSSNVSSETTKSTREITSTKERHVVVECGVTWITMNPLKKYNPITIMNFGGVSFTRSVAFCSNTYRQNYFKEFPNYLPSNFTIISPWLELGEYAFQKETPKGKFLFLGRCSTYKGLDIYLKIATHFKEYTFYVAGPREESEYTTEFSNLPNVVYLGVLNRKQRIEVLGKSTALIQPSTYFEPFGMNVIEANACGTPVITTKTGSFLETVKNGFNGFIVPDSLSFVNLKWILEQVHTLSRKQCHQYAKNNFNPDIAYQSYSYFFRELLG